MTLPTHEAPCTLALLHEETFLRQALHTLFAANTRYTVVANVADAPALKRAVATGITPHLVLLCIDAATAQHHLLLHWCARQLPQARVLLLGRHPEPDGLLAALYAGAHGYYCTHQSHQHLALLADHLLYGALHFPIAVQQQLRQGAPPAALAPPAHLRRPSPMQCEFLRWVCDPNDYTYAEIATHMGRSPAAVEKYRRELFIRYDLKNKVGLLRLAAQLGIGNGLASATQPR